MQLMRTCTCQGCLAGAQFHERALCALAGEGVRCALRSRMPHDVCSMKPSLDVQTAGATPACLCQCRLLATAGSGKTQLPRTCQVERCHPTADRMVMPRKAIKIWCL